MPREINFNVGGDPKDDQPILVTDNPPGGREFTGRLEPGRLIVALAETHEIDGAATLYYQGRQKWFRVIIPPIGAFQAEAGEPPQLPPEYNGDADKVALHYTADAVLSPLKPRGRYFWKDGDRFFLNGATGFNAPARLAFEGEAAIRPVFAQRQALGFNSSRFFSAYDIPGIGRCVPREIPDFYTRIVPTVSHIAAEYGQYPYWTVYAGANAETLGVRERMIEHQHRMEDAIGPLGFCLLDLHNEFNYSLNSPSQFIGPNPPDAIIWSQGSNLKDEDPPEPYGRFVARHPGSSEWQRKVGKQLYDFLQNSGLQIPGVDDETVRCEPTGETNRRHALNAAQCGVLFGAGAFYHSAQAKRFELLTGSEFDTAEGWCDGVASIVAQGLDVAQDGQYDRINDPNFLRVYTKALGGRVIRIEVSA